MDGSTEVDSFDRIRYTSSTWNDYDAEGNLITRWEPSVFHHSDINAFRYSSGFSPTSEVLSEVDPGVYALNLPQIVVDNQVPLLGFGGLDDVEELQGIYVKFNRVIEHNRLVQGANGTPNLIPTYSTSPLKLLNGETGEKIKVDLEYRNGLTDAFVGGLDRSLLI